MRVAVLGATGYVGGRLVPGLVSAGHEVRCLARTPQRLGTVSWRDDVDVVTADVLDRASLEAGLVDIDAVYYLVHAMGHAGDFETTDRLGAENLRDAAASTGVKRIVYLGGLGEDDPTKLSQHLASRHEVGEVLASGPVPVTELRAAVIIGSGSASFEMLRHLDEVLPIMVCPRWVTRTRCQPIGIADVLFYLVSVLEHADTAGRVLDIGGPDVLTYRDMMDRYAEVAGLRRRIIIRIPVLTPRLSSHWVNLVTPLPYALARPLVESLINDVVVHPERDIRLWIPHEPIGLDEAVRRALRQVKDLKVSTSWMDSAATSTSPASPSPHDPDWAGGTMLENRQEVHSAADPEALFAAVSGIGGDRGWYVANSLWTLRGWLDKVIGGVGMRRGRRHPDDLRVGDALDFFRVEDNDPPRLLRLRAEMLVPGDAWLEWTIEPTDGGGSVLRQHARFHPRGIAGRLYWWAMLPFHAVIFGRLARRLAAVAENA
ncbi:MAG: SDR family oxidoreductase [Acidimicrobiales bacterium]